jgi:dTDP-4-amino-4,6-dideoxygalactose transaminase
LANQPGLRRLDVPENIDPAWYQYQIFLELGIDRDALAEVLKTEHGIEAKGIYLPLHQETIFKNLDPGDLKQTEKTLLQSLCLRMHVGLNNEDLQRIAETLLAEIRKQMSSMRIFGHRREWLYRVPHYERACRRGTRGVCDLPVQS